MANTARIVLLDAESAVAPFPLRDEHLSTHVPEGLRALEPLRLTDFDAPPVVRRGPQARSVNWRDLGAAVVRLVGAAGEQGQSANAPQHTVLGGQAPLPVFTLAGYSLSAWGGDVTLVNRRDNGVWDVLRPDAPLQRPPVEPFDHVRGVPPEPAITAGAVAVFISTFGNPASRDELSAFCRKVGHTMNAVVEIRSSAPLMVDETNARAVAEQLRSTFARLHGLFPKREALVVFVAGSGALAFLVGRALKPLHGVVHLPNYLSAQLGYERAFTLPWGTAPAWPRREATIVFFSASPDRPGEDRPAIDEEVRAIQQKIRAAEHRDALKLVPWPAARPDDMLQALNQHAPVIVHFSGHGTRDGIVLLDDAGQPHVATHAALVKLFGLFADSVRLVVLNTCFGDVPAGAIAQHIDCVVGMPAEADDEAARKFAAAFYSALAFGWSVREAFDQGCASIELNNLPTSSHPRLVTKEGVDPAQVILIEGGAASRG